MKKIEKKNKANNILINSFTETKFSFLQYLNSVKKIYCKASKIFIGNIKKNYFHDYFENFLLLPRANKNNLFRIYRILKKKKIRIVFPTSDQELKFWSKNYNFFNSKNIEIYIMEFDKIKYFIDKFLFYKYCKANKISTPEIYSLNNLPLHTRMVLKEKNSNIKNLVMTNLDKNKIKLNIKKYKNPLIQQFINGKEYSIDTWKHKKTNEIEFLVRKRLVVINGDSKITEIVKNKYINNKIKNDLMKFDYYHHCVFQGILSKNKFYFTECNPRFGGASVTSLQRSIKSIHYFIAETFRKKLKYKNIKFNIQYKFETAYYK